MSYPRFGGMKFLAVAALATTLGCGGPTGSKPSGDISLFPLLAEGWLNGSAPGEQSLAGKVVVVNVWAYW